MVLYSYYKSVLNEALQKNGDDDDDDDDEGKAPTKDKRACKT